MVSVGGLVEDTDYTGLVSRVAAVLGQGSGQSGYGQRVPSAESYIGIGTSNTISTTEWNSLRTDINKCSQHQSDSNAVSGSMVSTHIIGADASGPNVTRISGDSFSIDTPTNSRGVNDWATAVVSIETNANSITSDNYTITDSRSFASSTRTTQWGGAGQGQTIYSEIAVVFEGGYTVTNSNGTTSTATGADHRRHFFNAGGVIRLSMFLSGSTPKDSDWGTMLGNAGFVEFGKNATTVTGTGRARDGSTDVDGLGGIDSAIGNFQLNTGYQLIFKKNGSATEYAENYVEIYAKRNSANNTITFKWEFTDADVGDQRPREPGAGDPAGPGEDEPVLQNAGSNMGCGIDLRRPSGSYVSVPEPAPDIITELRLT